MPVAPVTWGAGQVPGHTTSCPPPPSSASWQEAASSWPRSLWGSRISSLPQAKLLWAVASGLEGEWANSSGESREEAAERTRAPGSVRSWDLTAGQKRGRQRLLARTRTIAAQGLGSPKRVWTTGRQGGGSASSARRPRAAARPGTHLSASVGSQRPLPGPLRPVHESWSSSGVSNSKASKTK